MATTGRQTCLHPWASLCHAPPSFFTPNCGSFSRFLVARAVHQSTFMPSSSSLCRTPPLLLLAALAACADGKAVPAGPDLGPPSHQSGKTAAQVTGLAPYTQPVDPRFDPSRTIVAKRTPPPLSGGTMTVTSSGQVIAADPDRSLLYIIDVGARKTQTIELMEGDEPGRVITLGSRAYVALRGAGQVAVVELQSQTVSRVDVCAHPRGLAVGGNKGSVLLACAGGELLSLELNGKVKTRTWIADDLRDVGVDAGGIWLTRYRSAELLRVDAEGGISGRQLPSTLTRTEAFGADPIQFSATLAARTISDRAGHPLMLHQRAQSTPINVELGGYGGDQQCGSGIVHATVSRFDDDQRDPPASPTLASSVVPIDLALSPDGSRLAVVSPGGLSQQQTVRTEQRFGEGAFESGPSFGGNLPARQLALLDVEALSSVSGDDASTTVECFDDGPQWEHMFPGEVESVAFASDQQLVALVREPSELRVFSLGRDGSARLEDVIPLSDESVLDTGHQLFHQSAGLGIACASCHGEGHEDGHTWHFQGIGPRRTQSLLGGVLSSAPFHWDGDLQDFRALVDEVMTRRMGAPELGNGWMQALGSYIDAQPARVSTKPVEAEAVQRGKELFEAAARCTECHTGAAYGGKGRFDVGTGGSFTVPSLVGVAERLPLMHNGCATTLAERFDPACGGDRHGDTSDLSKAQIDDLVAFLTTL